MIRSDKTARQLYEELRDASRAGRFGHGRKAALVNVDLQRRYTDRSFSTSYETDPRQIEHVNALSAQFRAVGLPVFWTYVAYSETGDDCGLWGRFEGPLALRNVKHGSPMAELDPRLERASTDIVLHKRMGSAFFETNLLSYLVFHGLDTVFVTGGATSGCVRCTVVDAMSHGIRAIVPEECCADRHESPHYSSLYDMATKYADVVPVAEAIDIVATMARPETTHAA